MIWKVEKLIKDNIETLAMWRDAITAPVGANQHHDIVMTRKGEQGNSRSYTVSRLRREAPELYEEVREGRMSANAAAIRAKFYHHETLSCVTYRKVQPSPEGLLRFRIGLPSRNAVAKLLHSAIEVAIFGRENSNRFLPLCPQLPKLRFVKFKQFGVRHACALCRQGNIYQLKQLKLERKFVPN